MGSYLYVCDASVPPMTSLNDALRYPMDRDDWTRTVLIGGLLSLVGFLLVPLLFVYGYLARTIRRSLVNDPEPPTFDDWEDLLVDGAKVAAIGIAYFLIPAVVGAIVVGGSVVAIATGTGTGVASGLLGLFLGMLFVGALSLVFGYVAAAAAVNFVHEDDLSAAFDVGALRSIVFDADYFVAWLLSVAVFVGAGVIASVLNAVPVLGAIAAPFVFFYAMVVAANLWADGFRTATRRRDRTADAGLEDPAV